MTDNTAELAESDWNQIDRAIARLRASVMSVVFGMVGGFGLCFATVWLVARGAPEGQEIGPTLSLLGQYFPGYYVSWGGSVLGLIYGGLTGAVIGYVFAFVYNLIAGRRHGDRLKG